MNVLSLFDGMSCGQIALKKLNIYVDNYFASEIDKHAIAVTKHNFPQTIHLGDVTKIQTSFLPKIDLLIGGSPCQGFSFAGKQLNFNDPRSALFFEYVRLKNELQPEYFLLENVVMKKEYSDVITNYLGVEPVMINSSLVSAQNRKRLYWTNIPNIVQPKDKNLQLKDIIDKNNIEEDLKEYSRYVLKNDLNGFKAGTPRINYLRENLYLRKKNENSLTYLASVIEGDTPSKISRQTDRIYCVEGKAPCLTKVVKNIKIVFDKEKKLIRCLTPLEHERLQTVPDNYTNFVPDKNRKEMLGNGWTVDVIVHIFNNLPYL